MAGGLDRLDHRDGSTIGNVDLDRFEGMPPEKSTNWPLVILVSVVCLVILGGFFLVTAGVLGFWLDTDTSPFL